MAETPLTMKLVVWYWIGSAVIATIAVLCLTGWGMPDITIVGPRFGARIAALAPQVETTLLFLLLLPVSVHLLRAEDSPALRRGLAVTWRGCRIAVWEAAASQLGILAGMLTAGSVVWIAFSLVGAGPRLGEILQARLLLVGFAVFGMGLAVWARVAWCRTGAALGACALVLVGMMATPLALGPVIAVVGPWKLLLQGGMLVNPWIVMAGISGLDILHMQWIYALSPLGALETHYPSLPTAIAVYGGTGVVFFLLAIRILRSSTWSA